MMNLARREPFTIDISFDCGIGELEDFTLSVVQNGKTVLTKSMREALIADDGYSASLMLTGDETAMLRPCDPAWVQVRGDLPNGGEQHSAVYELNVVDVLNG